MTKEGGQMKVMVTGSDGYIGTGVVSRLLEAGNDVVALGLDPCGIKSGHLEEHIGDFSSYQFDGEAPDVLLHLAWRDGFRHNEYSHIDDLPKHFHFISRAIDAGVTRVAVMGTMHEVGYHEGAVTEDTPCNPTTPYGIAKNALRELTAFLCERGGATMQWLRGFYLVSNDGRGSSIFSKLVEASKSGSTTFPLTSGKNKCDFLLYEEFCDQVVAAVEQSQVNGIINICSGIGVGLGEYVEEFVRDNDLHLDLEYGKYPDRPYDSPAIWGDNTKIRKIMTKRQ
ncbi:NAD-dependent epimerase/dehydratase family protein [Granulimonas faecalis]|uniref:NAD-dependent epimerase/dehydratase family protein n=1 Tax=Granulimonas faecalis TaxID=2894155 RepID=UPI003515D941